MIQILNSSVAYPTSCGFPASATAVDFENNIFVTHPGTYFNGAALVAQELLKIIFGLEVAQMRTRLPRSRTIMMSRTVGRSGRDRGAFER